MIQLLQITEIQSPSERLKRLLDELPPGLGFPELKRRVEKLEQVVFGPDRRLRCFLSYRFNDENEAVSQKIKKYLTILDIEVITGEAYEPRKVSDKVFSKLQEPLDMIFLLVASDGESMWTRDEINTALQRGLFFIPIVEQGANFTPGLFGDLEWIPFERGHIGDTFLKLLEAIQFIRRKKIEEAIANNERS